VRVGVAIFLVGALFVSPFHIAAQERDAAKPEHPKTEPQYDDTFAGSIVELSSDKITVSRSILGKPAEKHVFLITADTRIEGKLRLKAKVTVGFVTSSQGDTARLIVVRPKPADKK
jgi:hypothetical protein